MIKLNANDKIILESYKNTIAGLSALFGSECEFVLHSLENLEKSVIAIENGHLSGRKVGAPITDKALSIINNNGKNSEYPKFNKVYKTVIASGENARSITIPIYNGKKLIGLLCINMNVDIKLSSFAEIFSLKDLSNKETHSFGSNNQEFFGSSIEDMIQNMMSKACSEVEKDKSVPNSDKNKEIIIKLNGMGFFNLRGSVEKIAEHLQISIHTVYSYIRKFSKDKNI